MSDLNDPQTTSVTPHNLPVQLTSFVGRKREIEQITRLLRDTRLLTLTGTGGVGKTRLGLEVASTQLDQYPDGVKFVMLGSIYDDQLVVHKVSSTLGCRGEGARPRLETLQKHLQNMDMLLILDNCEHLVDACADLSIKLLSACPDLQILATSREPLEVPGEKIFDVPPLSLPDWRQPMDCDNLMRAETVRLFLERANDYQTDFVVDDQTALEITRVCHLLDGIPLAVELTAARLRMFSISQIAEFLDDSLRFLTKGSRTMVPRHQTMQACIDWSYSLLDPTEQMMFRRLAVFAGEFTLDDVEPICGCQLITNDEDNHAYGIANRLEDEQILDLLTGLVDKSLVRVVPGPETSYRMLNPIQHHAWRKLSESGELDLLRDRHLNYYVELATGMQLLLRSAKQEKWINRIDLELDNLRAALDWSLQRGLKEIGLRLIVELGEFWWRQGYSFEGLEFLNKLLDPNLSNDVIYARALLIAGHMSRETGDYERANALCETSLKISRVLEYLPGIAESLCLLGIISHYYYIDIDKSIKLLDEGLKHYRQLDDKWGIASNLQFQADAQTRAGDIENATRSLQESLVFFQQYNDKVGIAFSIGALGWAALVCRNFEQALDLFRSALERGATINQQYLLEAIASLYAEQSKFHWAVHLWGYAEAWRDFTHLLLPPSFTKDYAPYIQKTRDALGEKTFTAGWQEGRSLSQEKAFDLAMQPSIFDEEGPGREVESRFGLTSRELEVLRLVARGLTDAQVAEELVISPRTVSKHLQSIYAKLQVSSRSAATRFALEQGIA